MEDGMVIKKGPRIEAWFSTPSTFWPPPETDGGWARRHIYAGLPVVSLGHCALREKTLDSMQTEGMIRRGLGERA